MEVKNQGSVYDGQIISAKPIEHRFNRADAFEIQLEIGIFNADGTPKAKVCTYLEMSMEYGKGNNASKTQIDISFETLHRLGFTGDDLTKLDMLKGKKCRVREQTMDKNGQAYPEPRYYIVSAPTITAINDANERLKKILAGAANPFGSANAATTEQKAADPFAAPGAESDPFAGM